MIVRFGGRVSDVYFVAARETSDGCMGSVFANRGDNTARMFVTGWALRDALVADGEDLAGWRVWRKESVTGWEWRDAGSAVAL